MFSSFISPEKTPYVKIQSPDFKVTLDFAGKISHDLLFEKFGSIRELAFNTFQLVACSKDSNVFCSV